MRLRPDLQLRQMSASMQDWQEELQGIHPELPGKYCSAHLEQAEDSLQTAHPWGHVWQFPGFGEGKKPAAHWQELGAERVKTAWGLHWRQAESDPSLQERQVLLQDRQFVASAFG